MLGHKPRCKETTRFIAELESLYRHVWRGTVFVVDDKALADATAAAGFRMLFVGIETPEMASLRECGKTQNSGRDLIGAAKSLWRKGFDVSARFIVGFDSDTPSVFDRQIAFIQESGIAIAMVGLLTAETGTRLYDRPEQEGRIKEVTSGNNTDGTLNFIPRLGPPHASGRVLADRTHDLLVESVLLPCSNVPFGVPRAEDRTQERQ